MTVTVPRPQRPPHRPRHRVLTLLVVVLLIAVPAAVLVRAGFLSRDSGEEKQAEAALTSLHFEWPSKVQRRVYEVPVPDGASYVAYYESNAWEKSTLYVQFRTSRKKLDGFLRELGSTRSALRNGEITITDEQARKVGWHFREAERDFAGVRLRNPEPDPDLSVTVDTTTSQRVRVYVVSTIGF